ncbi:phospholipase B domain-containing protein [Ditylenchus destructor]|nr:phospholipase B domain-containing protein [Ditylenchus destructor]
MYWFSWFNCPRSKIFARDHSKVTDLDSLTKLMRYNDYTHEEFSRCDCVPPYTAEAAISARGDLNPANGTYPLPGMGHVNHAALDYKGTNYQLFQQLRFRAWGGPTYDNVPVFKWSQTDLAKTVKHMGHPNEWNFKWVEYQWETSMN